MHARVCVVVVVGGYHFWEVRQRQLEGIRAREWVRHVRGLQAVTTGCPAHPCPETFALVRNPITGPPKLPDHADVKG